MLEVVKLKNFRSHKDYIIQLGEGLNIVVGPNASGKTNLLESIYLSLTGTSFRTSDINVLNNKSDWSRVDLSGLGFDRTVKLRKVNNKLIKEFIVNGDQSKTLNKNNKHPVVLFEPHVLSLINGSPTKRRDYLDKLISSFDEDYKKSLAVYKRALLQRNNLLKQNSSINDFFSWDIQLIDSGSKVIKKRKDIFKDINKDIETNYLSISGKKQKLEVVYNPSTSLQQFQTDLRESSNKDRIIGSTSVGPHRDDYLFVLGDSNADISASRGECRSIVLALKLFEIGCLSNAFDSTKPILLFDDVLGELDGSRRKKLTKILNDHQTIITTTDADVAIGLSKNSRIIPIQTK